VNLREDILNYSTSESWLRKPRSAEQLVFADEERQQKTYLAIGAAQLQPLGRRSKGALS